MNRLGSIMRRRRTAITTRPDRSGAAEAARHPGLAEAQALGARLPALLIAAERVAATVAQGVHGRRRAGMGDSFWQYRQAIPGEPAGRIDWRQSARSSRAYVRETEWEAAQSVLLWHDASPSMHWRSEASLPLKVERAELLLLALASLLLRGGEHVRLLAARDAGGWASGSAGLSRIAAGLARPTDPAASSLAGLPAPDIELPRHAHLVLLGDMLAEPAALEPWFGRLAAVPAGCTVLQVLDPAELSLPYAGRVRFEGLEGEPPLLASHAQALAAAYAAAMQAHQQRLAALCTRAGCRLVQHRTDQAPQAALLALYQSLHQGAAAAARVGASR